MTNLALLTGYALLLGWIAPHLMAPARWTRRAPHLAIDLWQALSVSFLATPLLAAADLFRPVLTGRHPGTAPGVGAELSAIVGAVLAAALVARVGCAIVRSRRRSHRARTQHAGALGLLAVNSDARGVAVLDQDTPAVYCLPGSRRTSRIIVTSAAVRLLTAAQLNAVLAHERAHLTKRHHRTIAAAHALVVAFPLIPLLHVANRETALLIEMAADDTALRHHDRRDLAGALVQLATATTPQSALGATGHGVLRRLERILTPLPPLSATARLATTGAAVVTPAVPIVLACAAIITVLTCLTTLAY